MPATTHNLDPVCVCMSGQPSRGLQSHAQQATLSLSRVSGNPHRITHYPSDILQPLPALHRIVSVAVPGLHHQSTPSSLASSRPPTVPTSCPTPTSVSASCFFFHPLAWHQTTAGRVQPWSNRPPRPCVQHLLVSAAVSLYYPAQNCHAHSYVVLPPSLDPEHPNLATTAALAKVTPNTGDSPLAGQATAGISHCIAMARTRCGNNYATKFMLLTGRQPAMHHAQFNLPTLTFRLR